MSLGSHLLKHFVFFFPPQKNAAPKADKRTSGASTVPDASKIAASLQGLNLASPRATDKAKANKAKAKPKR